MLYEFIAFYLILCSISAILTYYSLGQYFNFLFFFFIRSIDPNYPKNYRDDNKKYPDYLKIFREVGKPNPNIFVNPTTYISQKVFFSISNHRNEFGIHFVHLYLLGEFMGLFLVWQ